MSGAFRFIVVVVAVRVFAISAIVVVVVFDLFRTTVIVFRDLERASPRSERIQQDKYGGTQCRTATND